MSWTLYDYVDYDNENDFANWSRGLQKPELAKVNRILKQLEDNGPALAPQMLAGPLIGFAHIYKLKMNGKTAPRPLLCKGPVDNENEFTLLKGAFEVGGEWQPVSARTQASDRRTAVIGNPLKRRTPHVKVLR